MTYAPEKVKEPSAIVSTLPHFAPISPATRLSDQIAERLLAAILATDLRPGDRLPSERELGEQFAVSRTVVREAVRSLVGRGVIEARRGAGLTVAAVPASAVSASMNLYLRGSHGDIPYRHVHAVRKAIEVEMAGCAAQEATAEAVATLRERHARMGAMIARKENVSEVDLEFHRDIARMTGNELFLVVLDSIGDILLRVREETWRKPEIIGPAYEAHGRILEAIACRDVLGAQSAMLEHLERGFEIWLETSHRPGPSTEASA